MDSWFSFENGKKRDDISDVCLFNDAIQLKDGEERSIRGAVGKNRFMGQIELAMGQLDEVLDGALHGLNDDVIESVVSLFRQHLNKKKLDESRDEDLICTAVVQCNFADVEGLEKRVKAALRADRVACTSIRITSTDTPIRNIIDAAQNAKSGFIFIEQAECLSMDYVDRLFRLLNWSRITLPVLVCVSTDISSFSSLCSLRSLNMLSASSFSLASPSAVYEKILTAIHYWDIDFCFSGEVLAHIRNNFFGCDHSVAEVKRTLRFALLNHVLANPTAFSHETEKNEFSAHRAYYWRLLELLCEQLGKPFVGKMFELHEDIQRGRGFMDNGDGEQESEERTDYLTWRQNLSLDVIEHVLLDEFEETERSRVEAAISNLRRVAEEERNRMETEETQTEKQTATPKGKMSLNDLKRQNEAMRNKKLNDPVKAATNALRTVVEKCLKSVLCPWSKLDCAKPFLVDSTSISQLHCNPAKELEEAMIFKQNENAPSLSFAFRSLLRRPRWNHATLTEWGAEFEQELSPRLKPHAHAAFYASLAQLEMMGVVKSGAERQKGRVNVIYHPTTYTE